MDRLVERFLTKIEVKDMKPFENSFFTKMENLKEINKIVATLSVEKYLPITSYIDFFRGTAEIEKRGIFISDITFKYRSEDDILDLVDDYLDYYEVFDIDDVKVDENNLYLCYHDLSFDTLLKDTVARLKKFLKEINSKYIPSLAYNPEFISEEKKKISMMILMILISTLKKKLIIEKKQSILRTYKFKLKKNGNKSKKICKCFTL